MGVRGYRLPDEALRGEALPSASASSKTPWSSSKEPFAISRYRRNCRGLDWVAPSAMFRETL